MEFRKVKRADTDQTNNLFTACLSKLLVSENIQEEGLLENEVARLQKNVEQSFDQPEQLFFIAEKDGTVAGTIALSQPGPMISSAIALPRGCLEIGCVYVRPEFQRQGIGKFMLQRAQSELEWLNRPFYCLDAGFPSSQRYWKSILGEPGFVLKDYWGPGKPHMFWLKNLNEKS
ncbi:GNAT family N-acetyltransferase [Planomicrobium sp. CPCC 101079]|uniref:GNAT family N-acetyltransferase n=1 Tax=Planomicrobium sp. CPCC 101079 TaxID=2599618 RepID=UPI0011B5A330|nr:GNAT family N-acetyltransferase [Planomicrobium sp. CPCC 101079]TWT14341.1 GNAT family N-acetyltransferase [Planomicrobium sp. CPCC 101079]